MSLISSVLRTTFILSSITTSFAAICNENQVRASGDPSGEELSAFLNSDNQISSFCLEDVSGKTSGSMNFSTFQISFERSDSSNSTLVHCTEAIEDIISQCIEPSDPGTYGGNSALFDNGEMYTISNIAYPEAPIVTSDLENRAVVEDSAVKAPAKASPKAPTKPAVKTTAKTTAKTTPKATVAPATTSPKTTQTTLKTTETPKTTSSKATETTLKVTPTPATTSSKSTQTTPITSKSSTTNTTPSSSAIKITSPATSSKTTEPVPTTSKSTSSSSISSTKSSIQESSTTSTNSISKSSISVSSLSSLSSIKSNIAGSSTSVKSIPTSELSSSASSTKLPSTMSLSVTPATSTLVKSSTISSNTQEPSSKTAEPSSNSLVTTPLGSSSQKITSQTGISTNSIHISDISTTAISTGSIVSETKSSSVSSKTVSSSSKSSSSTKSATSSLDISTQAILTGTPAAVSSATSTIPISSAFSSSITEITPGPSAARSSAIASSVPVESSNPVAQSSNAEQSNGIPASSITAIISSGSSTSLVQPEITPAPSSPSSLVSEAVPLTSSSEPASQGVSTHSLTSSIQPEITPSPSDSLASGAVSTTSIPESISQVVSTGSLTSSAEPEITSSPSETYDPSEVSPPETTESSPTDTALVSPTSSPVCSDTAGGNCTTCYQYSGSGDIAPSTSNSTNSTNLQYRDLPPSIAGRISTADLHTKLSKRATESLTSFDAANSCVFNSVDIPSIPDPSDLVSKAGSQTEYWYVLEDTVMNGTSCPVLGFTKVPDEALASHLIDDLSTAVGYAKAGSGIGWKEDAPTVVVNSVYESSILQDFFASRVNDSNCEAFKSVFDQINDGNGRSMLQTVWDQLPSDTNPDYAGMDQKISTIKSQVFKGDVQQSHTSNDEKLAYISELAVAVAITNDDAIASLFQATNLRIYQVLLKMDQVIGNNSAPGHLEPDWAPTYRTYMTNILATRSSSIQSEVSSYLDIDLGPAARSDNITLPDGTETTTENSIGNGVDAFLKAYPLSSAFTFDQEKLLGFPSA